MKPETHLLLHSLWTKAVGTPGYDKSQWRELERTLERAESREVLHSRILPPFKSVSEAESFLRESLASRGVSVVSLNVGRDSDSLFWSFALHGPSGVRSVRATTDDALSKASLSDVADRVANWASP